MLWHLAFGIEAGLDALVSPTHLLLLTGGTLLLTSPLRAAAATDRDRWPAVVSMAAATSLAGFFLSYVSVFGRPWGAGTAPQPTYRPAGASGRRTSRYRCSGSGGRCNAPS
jgi:hypothetical protein